MKISRSKAQSILDNMVQEYKQLKDDIRKLNSLHKAYRQAVNKYPELEIAPGRYDANRIMRQEKLNRMDELRPKILRIKKALGEW